MNRLFGFIRDSGLPRVSGLVRNFGLVRFWGLVRDSGLAFRSGLIRGAGFIRRFGLVQNSGSVWNTRMIRRTGLIAGLIILLAAGIRFALWNRPLNIQQAVDVRIPKGLALSQIAGMLESKGILRNKIDLTWPASLFGLSKQLKAGHYRFEGRISPRDVIRMLTAGRVVQISVTIPEGTRVRVVASMLHKKLGLDSAAFVRRAADPAFSRSLGVAAESLEGYLFPETYFVDEASGADDIIRMAVGMFFERVTDTLVNRAKASGFTLHQAVTLASIVEGEAMLDAERPMIAALYLNRLRLGMPLQADPTIQYLIPDGPRRLLRKDLSIRSPYNTYLHAGLPPGPINNPGLASILAVLDPAHEPVLFMVANGDGSHTFSTNLRDHAIAKSRFDRIRGNVARQERLTRSKIEKSAQ